MTLKMSVAFEAEEIGVCKPNSMRSNSKPMVSDDALIALRIEVT